MWSDILEQAGWLRAQEEPFVLATVVAYKSPQSAKPGSKAIIRADGSITGWVGGGCVQPIVLREARKALQSGKPKLLSVSPESAHEDWEGVESFLMACEGGGSLEIYLEPVIPKPELLIVGRSPVAQTVAELGRLLEFKVCLADPEAGKEQFPDVDLILNDLSIVRNHISERSYVVVATMGTGDEEGLQAVLGTSPRYLGLVASEKKARSLFQYVREKGASEAQLSRVKCPAGLELGSETIPEIALSVMAEITQLRRASSATSTSFAGGVTLPILPAETASTSTFGSSVTLPILPTETAPLEFPHAETADTESLEAFDPVCGMTVETQNARYATVLENKTFFFCSLRCKETFDR